MSIKVIVELRAKAGRRAELRQVFESLLADHGLSMRGFLGSTRYDVLDDPDLLVEIADWESAAARDEHLQQAAAVGAFEPLLPLLAGPFRATVLSELQ
jgi:quinol monooxygenase YgiN